MNGDKSTTEKQDHTPDSHPPGNALQTGGKRPRGPHKKAWELTYIRVWYKITREAYQEYGFL